MWASQYNCFLDYVDHSLVVACNLNLTVAKWAEKICTVGPVGERLQDTNESSLAGIIIVQHLLIDMLAVNEHILRALGSS